MARFAQGLTPRLPEIPANVARRSGDTIIANVLKFPNIGATDRVLKFRQGVLPSQVLLLQPFQ